VVAVECGAVFVVEEFCQGQVVWEDEGADCVVGEELGFVVQDVVDYLAVTG